MGGCGGKKQRERQKAATIGGKFDSTGKANDQKANCALVTAKLGEVLGMMHENPAQNSNPWVTKDDLIFMEDVKIKLNQSGSGAVFGWRQVEAIIYLHRRVKEKWEAYRRESNTDTAR